MQQNHLPRQRTASAVGVIAAERVADAHRLARLTAAFLLAVALLATAFSGKVLAADSENIRIAKALSNAYAEVVDKVSPGVVGIETEKIVKRSSGMGGGMGQDPQEFFERFFDLPGGPRRSIPRQTPSEPETRKQGGIGSGVVIDSEGHILTNNHVVADADNIKVEFATEKGKTYKAEIVGRDPNSDLAVIKLVEKPAVVPVVALGDSDALNPGNIIIAIGSPLGYKNSVTTGVVSATGRNLNELAYERFIQTDAAINPGNSGGPMVNLDGEVVGINTMISTRGSMGSIGIGFAIPINQAKSVVKQLIEKGSVTRGWLGIVMNPEDKDISLELGHDGTGVLISDVDPSGPATKAGIRKGDLIVSFDSISIKDNDHLRYLVADTAPGRDVPLVVVRDGERVNLSINIEAQPDDLYTNTSRLRNNGEGSMDGGQTEVATSLGMTVRNLDKETREQYSISEKVASGVVVTKVDNEGEAREMGIRPGAVILEMNRLPVKDVASFRKVLKDSAGKDKILIYLRYGEVGRYLMLNLK